MPSSHRRPVGKAQASNMSRQSLLPQHELEELVRERLRKRQSANGVTVMVNGIEYMLQLHCTICGLNHPTETCKAPKPKIEPSFPMDIGKQAGILNRHGNIKSSVVNEIAEAVAQKLHLANAERAGRNGPAPAARFGPNIHDIRAAIPRGAFRGRPRGGFQGGFQPQPRGGNRFHQGNFPQRPAQQLPDRGGFRGRNPGLFRGRFPPRPVRAPRSAPESEVDWNNLMGDNDSDTAIEKEDAHSAPKLEGSGSESTIATDGQGSDDSEDLVRKANMYWREKMDKLTNPPDFLRMNSTLD